MPSGNSKGGYLKPPRFKLGIMFNRYGVYSRIYNRHNILRHHTLILIHMLPILSEVVLQKCPPATAEDIDNPELTGDLFEWLNEIMEKHKNLYANADFSNDQLPAGFGVVPTAGFTTVTIFYDTIH